MRMLFEKRLALLNGHRVRVHLPYLLELLPRQGQQILANREIDLADDRHLRRAQKRIVRQNCPRDRVFDRHDGVFRLPLFQENEHVPEGFTGEGDIAAWEAFRRCFVVE